MNNEDGMGQFKVGSHRGRSSNGCSDGQQRRAGAVVSASAPVSGARMLRMWHVGGMLVAWPEPV